MNAAQAEEEIEGEEAHKFHQVKSVKDQDRRYSAALGFPVAVRPMLAEGTNSWTTIIAEEDFEEEKVQQPTDQVFLKSAYNFYEWDSFLHQVLQLPFNIYWQGIVVLSIAFNYFFTTYKYSYMVVIQEENEADLLYEAAITDLIYLIDFAIALTHCCWRSLHLYMHVRRRCKLAIMVDILSLAPIEYVYYVCFPNSVTSKNMLLARSPSFLRLYRISNFFMEWANRAEGTHWGMHVIGYVFYLVLLLHSMLCLWFSLGCIENCYNVKSWALLLGTFDIDAYTTTNWYFISFYFSLSTISNAGFGDIVPINLVEHITCIFAMMCGFILTTGYYIGALTILKTNAGRRRGLFVDLLWAIKRHLIDIKLQSKRLKLILKYYEMLWIKRRGVTKAHDFQLLPLSLQMEVCFDISVAVFDNSLLFRRKEEPFLRKLSLLMKSAFHLPGETIFYQNVAKYKMICIMSGVVEILSAEDNESPVISFTTGTVLGEISLVLTVPAKATVRAATYTELQVLHKADFFRMMVNFPGIHKMIQREIGTRIRAAYSQNVSEDKSEILLNLFVSRSKVKTPIRAVKDALRATQTTTPAQTALEEVDKLTKSYLSLYKTSENISHEEENVCYSSTFPWILEPDSHLTMFWDTAVFIVVVLVSIMYPYCIAFTRDFPSWMNTLSISFDVVYFMDIVVRSITAIRKTNRLICNWKEICSEQMTMLSFYLDVFAIFPIEIAAVPIADKEVNERVYSTLKLNRLLKAWKIPAYFIKLEQNLWANMLLLCCCKYILCLIIVSIWVGSVLYMEACFFDPCDENNWFAVKVETQIGKQNKYPCFDNPELMSVYFAFSLLSRTGFGDILPESLLDMIFSCLFLMVGLIIFGYCIAEMCATHSEMERSRTEYQEAMFATIKFMAGNKMSKTIQDRVINYFRLQWEYNKGVKVMDSTDLLADAPLEMQQEVLIKERVETLRDIPLFMDVDKDFLQLIAMSCRTQLLPSHEIITYAGDLSREMYIIQEGYCEVISGKTGIVESSVGPKHYFGDLEMLYGIPRIVSVRSVTHCKVISIEYSAYAQAVSMFTKVLDENQQVMKDSELLKFIKKLSSGKKIFPDKISLLKKGTKSYNIHRYKTVFVTHFKDSFKYVPDECKKLGEDYSAPFKSLKKFFFVKCLLLPWCILPQGKFLKYWYSMRTLTAFIVTLYCPYQESKSDVYTDYDLLTIILDIIAYIDLYVMLHVGYYNEKGILVIHPKCTSKYYLTHGFPLDLIACFPFSQCLRLLSGSWNESSVKVTHLEGAKVEIGYMQIMHTVLRLNRTLQIYRLFAEIRAIESNILRQSSHVRILKFFPFTILFLNMLASLIVAITCRTVPSSFMNSSSGAQAHTHIHLTSEQEVMACEEGCWLDDSHFQNTTDILELYTVAFYWVTSTFMGAGIGDIAAQSGSEMVVIMSIIIFGSLMFGYMCASLGSSKASLENTLSQYQEMITELIDFMEREFVNEDLQRRIIQHFEYEWKRRAGVQPYKIFTKLHSSLMQDAMLEMYERTLREVPLFENVEQSFLQIIGTHLQESYFLRGETVVRSQDVQTNIYIIFRGKVEVLSKYNEMIACMGSGGMFGNISSVSATICSVTITASRNLDVLTLPSSTFYSVLNKYPNMKRKMDTILSTVKDYIVPSTIIESDESWDDSSPTLRSASITSKRTSVGNSTMFSYASVTTGGTLGTIATYTSILIPPNWSQFAILPESSIYTVLSVSVLISSYLSFMLVSYLFAFQDYNMPLVIFSFSLDVIFYFKIFLELHQAYLDRYGEYVIDMKKIRSHYLKNKYKLILDIIANFPLALFSLAVPYGKRSKVMSILRLTNLFRLGYVVLFYRSRSNLLMANKLYLRIGIIFTCLTAYAHCLACIWYLIGCPLHQCSDYSWAYYAGLRSTTPACESYVISLYYVVSLFTRTGYGDIQPHNFFEMLVTSAMMIISMFFIAIVIADITLMFRTSQSTLHNYEYGITELRDSLRNQSVSSHQMDKVWNYVRKLWQQGRGKQMPRLIIWAPTVLKSELMNAIYSHHLRNSYIFANTNEDFLRQLAVKLKHCVFFEGNYIVQHGDTDQNMYFIHRGEVSILTVHGNLTETIHDVLKTGDMFGVAQGLYHGLPHHFSFRAKSVVDIVILNLDSWYHMLKYFPQSKDIIYSRAGNIYMNV